MLTAFYPAVIVPAQMQLFDGRLQNDAVSDHKDTRFPQQFAEK